MKDVTTKLRELGVEPQDIDLYIRAFTHVSAANESQIQSYEQLEYIGDSIVQMLLRSYFCKHHRDLRLYDMNCRINFFASNYFLGKIGLKLKLHESLIFDADGGFRDIGLNTTGLNADLVEALLAAITFDQGLEEAAWFFATHFEPIIQKLIASGAWQAHEMLEKSFSRQAISHETKTIHGRGSENNVAYHVTLKVGDEIMGKGEAYKKSFARHEAAMEALIKIGVLQESDRL